MNLNNWLKSKNFFTRTTDTPSPSHLLYNGYEGGKLYIPRNHEYSFLCEYAKELSNKSQLFFIETRPITFKFMLDIDISDDHYWTRPEIINLIRIIQKTVFDFFEVNNVVICCTSPVKIKHDDIHTGIHLIWPQIFVMSDTALCIRRGITQKLQLELKPPQSKTWESIIDETIFTKNGYRMVGSDKITKTKNEKIIENRPLSLFFVMNSDGELSEDYFTRLNSTPKDLALETSIRYVMDAYLDHGMPIKVPNWMENDVFQTKKGNRTSSGTIISSEEHIVIENFITKNLPKKYWGCVKAVTRYPKEGSFPDAFLIKTSSKYCMNVGREHNSCGVYFYATYEGMRQKCLCTCDKLENRKTGLCKNFTSGLYQFDDEIKKILFPDHDKNLFIDSSADVSSANFSSANFSSANFSSADDKLRKGEPRRGVRPRKGRKATLNYEPGTKANLIKQQQKLCDKLYSDITRERLD